MFLKGTVSSYKLTGLLNILMNCLDWPGKL